MPTYQVYVNQNKLDPGQKKAVARAITEGHCRLTGAPEYFVQVIIQEIADENRYICGKQFDRNMWIRGDVRCRTPEQNKVSSKSRFHPRPLCIHGKRLRP